MALQNFSINIDDAAYQAALERAQLEGRTLEAVLVELLTEFGGNEPTKMLTTYTVKTRRLALSHCPRDIR